MSDVADIAKGLSEAQRRAVQSCWQDAARHAPYHVFRNCAAFRAAWRTLLGVGFVTRDAEGFDLVIHRGRPLAMVSLTTLGLAVRTYLESRRG